MALRLFEAMVCEWAALGDTPAAKAAFGRWAAVEPALAGMSSPAEAVRRCQSADAVSAAAVLGALLRHASEDLAARAVLQAVLPSLRVQAARRGGGVGRRNATEGWEGGEDFDADVVAAALGRIAELAGTTPAWPAQRISEAAWGSMHASLKRGARRGVAPGTLDAEADNVVAAPARTGAEDLALAVATAVRTRWLAASDAQVIYATRVLGYTPDEVAAAQGRDVRALRAQRARAERRLVHAGWAPPTGMVPCRSVSATSGATG